MEQEVIDKVVRRTWIAGSMSRMIEGEEGASFRKEEYQSAERVEDYV